MRPIFYDTETTGINVANDSIIEIAAYDPQRNLEFVEFINPGRPIPAEASAVHHITDEMVADADDFAAVGQRFIDFCDDDVVLIAHNNDRFDLPFLKYEFTRHGLEMPQWKTLDSLKWARRYRYDLPRHSLQFLREVYSIPANQAHRALDDVKILYRVFESMVDDLPIDKVYSLMSQPRLVVRMPFGKYKGKALSEIPQSYVDWLNDSGAFDKEDNETLRYSFEQAGMLSTQKRSSSNSEALASVSNP